MAADINHALDINMKANVLVTSFGYRKGHRMAASLSIAIPTILAMEANKAKCPTKLLIML